MIENKRGKKKKKTKYSHRGMRTGGGFEVDTPGQGGSPEAFALGVTGESGGCSSGVERRPRRGPGGARMGKQREVLLVESFKDDELPTPRKSNVFERRLIDIICEKRRLEEFQKFLEERKYDTDFLEFVVRVMEFKKEAIAEEALRVALEIYGKYVDEETSLENYLEFEDKSIAEEIREGLQQCEEAFKVGSGDEGFLRSLFDRAVTEVSGKHACSLTHWMHVDLEEAGQAY